ncbi:HutD family protein [Streptacidiphilus sp. P02-A3a]|uniref:HutD/Ves family protein n=1 Tax=Streptacidiphilus sp. P02-A3a TaxID=2704468 RepID=UPI0015FDC1E7|nr:HutD family protein [Streptacidiphilus sp. P02-A3a]QMU70789.1 HutD family protein [Streptacidiphilus sp. P02-A3a]
MAARVLRAAERSASAWKNGGGVTREVAAFPEGSGLAEFHWRVSLADVARGGPFSVFPGVDRVITVVRGAGMLLTVDGVERRVDTPYQPFAFSGDADTGCRLLEGPLVDFNVMTRRERVSARVDVVDGSVPLRGEAEVTLLAMVLEGGAELRGSDDDTGAVALGPLDAVLLTGTESATLDVRGRAAVVTFRQLD